MLSRRRELQPRLLVDFSQFFGVETNPRKLSAGASLDGRVLMALLTSQEPLTEERGFPRSHTTKPSVIKVVQWKAGQFQSAEVGGETLVPHFVQPADDGFLLVGARCRWRPDGPEKNALLCSWEGAVRSRHTLGDGIEDARVEGDRVWVSYFDEGVFGNYGWGLPNSLEPIGSSGLVAFDMAGRKTFEYDPMKAGTKPIADAYALNVLSEEEVWVYHYTDFPIVRIAGGQYAVWKCGYGGAHGLAIADDMILLVGAYGDLAHGRIMSLQPNGTTNLAKEVIVRTPQGQPMTEARASGIGPKLYLFHGARAYLLDDWSGSG